MEEQILYFLFKNPKSEYCFFLFKELFQLTAILKISLNVEKKTESAYVASSYIRGKGRFEQKPISNRDQKIFLCFS